MSRTRVALVTGSATGLGVQTVLSLAEAGHHVAINYRNSYEQALLLKKRVEQLGVKCQLIQGDIASEAECLQIVAGTLNEFDSIDILVNNAGPYLFNHKKLVDYSAEEWNSMVNGNLSAVFHLSKAIIPIMRKQRWGRIITFGFAHASQAAGWVGRSAYAAAKVGLVSLTKTMAQEEFDSGITVNMICPGDIIGKHKEMKISDVKEIASAHSSRPGVGEDIARVVVFLCEPNSDHITGSIIDVNGSITLDQIDT